jgi:hypothetical protein
MRCADARLSPMQRARVVEPHLYKQNQPLTKLPFDELWANGGFLKVPLLFGDVIAFTQSDV